jgi:hypothetical protein
MLPEQRLGPVDEKVRTPSGDLYFGRFIYIVARSAHSTRRGVAGSSETTRVSRFAILREGGEK